MRFGYKTSRDIWQGNERRVTDMRPIRAQPTAPYRQNCTRKSSPNCSRCNRTLTMTRSQLNLVTCTRHDSLHTRLINVETTPCTLMDLSEKPHLFKTREFHSWTRNMVTWLRAQVATVNAGLDCQQDSSLCAPRRHLLDPEVWQETTPTVPLKT